MKLGSGKRDPGEGTSQPHSTTAIAGSGPKKRRASSSALTPGAGGGRHPAVKMTLNSRPSTAPSSPSANPKGHVKMLNGRVYGARRYAGEHYVCLVLHADLTYPPIAAQTLANPFANVRDDPEFVEWGYGGMGSVHASAGIADDMWKGLQRSERGGALFAGSSFGSSSESAQPPAPVTVGGGRGSGARATSPIGRRKMLDDVPECGMGNVGAVRDEDDGSGMGWVKRRRAEREAKARLEQAAKDKSPEGRKSGDSMDASMYASTVSTACTSGASTDITTPATSPLTSRSPSLVDLDPTSSPLESHQLPAATCSAAGEKSTRSNSPSHPASPSKEDHEHRVFTVSPDISRLSHKRSHSAIHGCTPSLSCTLSQTDSDADNESPEQAAPLSPVDTEETTASTSSLGIDGEEPSRGSDDGEGDDDEEEVQVSHVLSHSQCINTSLYRISRGKLLLELASRKSVDMWTPRCGKHARHFLHLVQRLCVRVQSGECQAPFVTLRCIVFGCLDILFISFSVSLFCMEANEVANGLLSHGSAVMPYRKVLCRPQLQQQYAFARMLTLLFGYVSFTMLKEKAHRVQIA